ncbi:hypothetical protein B0H11DRAFT_1931992 [Mycena galericulata]|nr:hypothetical protein B0H11DRAFT_1931992 [Mycena galericulata]
MTTDAYKIYKSVGISEARVQFPTRRFESLKLRLSFLPVSPHVTHYACAQVRAAAGRTAPSGARILADFEKALWDYKEAADALHKAHPRVLPLGHRRPPEVVTTYPCHPFAVLRAGRSRASLASMAKLWNLPYVFVSENNNYGMGPFVERSSSNTGYFTCAGDKVPGLQQQRKAMRVQGANQNEYIADILLASFPRDVEQPVTACLEWN